LGTVYVLDLSAIVDWGISGAPSRHWIAPA
jgi:hypothetical protein